jgi:chromosome segregation ATPase
MATSNFILTYADSVTPKPQKYLKSEALKLEFTGTLELDETDGSKFKAIQKEFQKLMKSRIKKQLGFLDKWLGEKNKLIEVMMKEHEKAKKFGFPSTASEAKAIAAKNKALEKIAEQTNNLKKEYVKIVNDWAQNASAQQGRNCAMVAVKNVRKKTLNAKSFRVGAGIAIKAVLVVAAIALAVAATVLSAGTVLPIFTALAATGLALSGIAGIADVGKRIKDSANTEKKILTNVQKDIKVVEAALKPLDNTRSNLAKHVTELLNVMKLRTDSMKQIKSKVQEKNAQIKGYQAQLDKLDAELKKQTPPDKKILAESASRRKKITALDKQVNTLKAQLTRADQDNKEAVQLLQKLRDMNVQLDKISGQSASTVAGNLKERFKKVDGWIDLSNELGGLVSGVSGLG